MAKKQGEFETITRKDETITRYDETEFKGPGEEVRKEAEEEVKAEVEGNSVITMRNGKPMRRVFVGGKCVREEDAGRL